MNESIYAPPKSDVSVNLDTEGPSGVRGWLLVLAIELIATGAFKIVQLVYLIQDFFTTGSTALTFQGSYGTYIFFIYIGALVFLILAILTILSILLLFTRSRYFVRTYVSMQVLFVAQFLYSWIIISYLFSKIINPVSIQLVMAITATLFSIYVLSSKRVRNTFTQKQAD
jgi:hypothetical protein